MIGSMLWRLYTVVYSTYVRTGGGSGRVYGSSIGTLVFLNKCSVFLDASQRVNVI